MNTAVINIKTDPVLKKKAQAVASELGVSLSTVIKALLQQFVRTKTLVLTGERDLTPWAKKMLEESKKDIAAGRVSPSFDNAKDAIRWLNKSKNQYED